MMPLLLQAEGEGWKLEILGKLPDLPPFLKVKPQTQILADGITSLEVFDRSTQVMRPVKCGELIEPLLFESVIYDIHIEKKDSSTKIKLPLGAEARRIRFENEHYTLNFGNNVGHFDITISRALGFAKLQLEVFSRKVDYRNDYIAMRDEVSGMLRNLAMAASARTYGLSAPAKDNNPTLTEWFALIERYFDDFIKLANVIAKKPHNQLAKKNKLVNSDKARVVSRQTIERAFRKVSCGEFFNNIHITLPRKIHENISHSTINTPENRYYKALIKETYRNIRALSKISGSGDEDANISTEKKFFESVSPRLKIMERKVESILRSPYISSIADTELTRPNSMVIYKHPIYSQFDKICRLLNGGLSFADNIISIGVKETSLLYEYWCFLKIIFLLRNHFELEEQNVVMFKRLKMTVSLSKGQQSALKFIHKPSGKNIYLVYNRLFNRLPTIAQQPDNVIQFASSERFYIFDAKYRIQFDKDYISYYGGPGPKTDDINTMHRYRDAIAIPHPMKNGSWKTGAVIGAIVLFPYPDEDKYLAHKFFQSIRQVEIGGLPFMPKTTELVNNKINDILKEQFPELFM